MKRIVIAVIGGLTLAGAAAAMAVTATPTTAKEAECARLADAKDFGIHEYQRHRFVIRCVSNLPDLDLYDRD